MANDAIKDTEDPEQGHQVLQQGRCQSSARRLGLQRRASTDSHELESGGRILCPADLEETDCRGGYQAVLEAAIHAAMATAMDSTQHK